MPEGDTLHNLAARLRPVLVGKALTGCDIRVPRYATVDLTGRTVDEVSARGKHLLIRLGGAVIHSHLAMEGEWHVYRPGERWRRPGHTARAVLEVDGAQVVGFSLRLLEVLSADATDGAAGAGTVEGALAHLGPDPLGPDWDAGRAAANLAADPSRPVGLALLDQRNLAGVGNVYRNELCFVRGAHPGTPVAECGDPRGWAEDAARLLRANVGRTLRVTTGVDRKGLRTFVYDRARRPCLRCGTAIVAGSLGAAGEPDRAIWWCPACQPG